MSYDLIVVGAGIAGLYTGLQYSHKHPSKSVLILEKYDYIGGRIVTGRVKYVPGRQKAQWEIGAGRIATTHTMIRSLMKRYGLTWLPLAPTSSKLFADLMPAMFGPLQALPAKTLARYTLAQLLAAIHGKAKAAKFYKLFPYWSEIHTLRADLALKTFMNEMNPSAEFGCCKEGYSAIIDGLAKELAERKVEIKLNSEVVSLKDTTITLKDNTTYKASKVVLALHLAALKDIMPHLHQLKHLSMQPLVRMYAIFPKTWFADLPKLVVPGKLRYIIPINPKIGSIMISYTDGADARYWMARYNGKGKEAVQEEVMTEVRKLFPTRHIPDPIVFKVYPWTDGCTYWLPGDYDPEVVSKELMTPRKNVYICGESISMKQAWMEGALESARDLCALLDK